jgi:hypothetical protein
MNLVLFSCNNTYTYHVLRFEISLTFGISSLKQIGTEFQKAFDQIDSFLLLKN